MGQHLRTTTLYSRNLVSPARVSSADNVKFGLHARRSMEHICPPARNPTARFALPGIDVTPEQTTNAVYVGLGLTLVSFILTFGVAPRFRSAFRESETWQEMYPDFMARGGVESIPPRQAIERAARGYDMCYCIVCSEYSESSASFAVLRGLGFSLLRRALMV
jgi:hypothetical protein